MQPHRARRGIATIAIATLALVGAGCGASGGEERSDRATDERVDDGDRAQSNACTTEWKTVRTAIAAWQAAASSGDRLFATAYPTSPDDLVAPGTQMLERLPQYYTFEGDGTTMPTITSLDVDVCPDEP